MKLPGLPTFILAMTFASTAPLMQAKPPQAHVAYAGGDGSSYEKAIIVKAADEQTGVHAEYQYLDKHFPGNKRGGQSLQSSGGKSYDVLEFTTAKGEAKKLYFDITAFFGKG